MALPTGVLLALVLMTADASAIVGGTAPNRTWPAQGLLSIATTPARACGGTLVSGRWFLTAGHCVTDKAAAGQPVLPAGILTVSLGESDTTRYAASERFAVAEIVRHPDYTPRAMTAGNDVALLRLATPAPATPSIQPMRILTADDTALWAPGVVATIIGWGATVTGGPYPAELVQAGVPVRTDDVCATAYPAGDPNPFDLSSMFCAGDGTSDACQGDSGGPIMVPRVDEFALAGVTSYGSGCADPTRPGIYARVGAAALNSWVRTVIPTAAISIAPGSPNPGEDVALQATGTQPASETGVRAYSWDLDDDGAYDDAVGARATLRPIAAGSTVVRVQESYPDGDRALAREVVTTAGSPRPLPPPPPPPPPRPAAAPPPAGGGAAAAPDGTAAAPGRASSVTGVA
ncbi:MAG: tryptase, partial [Solirubrobacteraceae bacterium]|nr:tryptase [Solirubrobacteraceae bacterium]